MAVELQCDLGFSGLCLDYVWISDVGDDSHSSAAPRAEGNIDVKDSLKSLSPG